MRVRAEDAAATGSREPLPPESAEGTGAAPRGPQASGLRNWARAVSPVRAAPWEAFDTGETGSKAWVAEDQGGRQPARWRPRSKCLSGDPEGHAPTLAGSEGQISGSPLHIASFTSGSAGPRGVSI